MVLCCEERPVLKKDFCDHHRQHQTRHSLDSRYHVIKDILIPPVAVLSGSESRLGRLWNHLGQQIICKEARGGTKDCRGNSMQVRHGLFGFLNCSRTKQSMSDLHAGPTVYCCIVRIRERGAWDDCGIILVDRRIDYLQQDPNREVAQYAPGEYLYETNRIPGTGRYLVCVPGTWPGTVTCNTPSTGTIIFFFESSNFFQPSVFPDRITT